MTGKPRTPSGKPGDGKPGDGKPGDGTGKPADGKPPLKSGDVDASAGVGPAQEVIRAKLEDGQAGGGGKPGEPPTPPSSTAHTRPSGQPDPNARPGGTPSDTSHGSVENRENLRIENDSATVLAKAGYRIDQNPPEVGVNGRSNPDYKMEGKLWDNYAPRDNRETIRRELRKKVKEQTPYIVINMERSTMSLADMKALLPTVKGLTEVKIIDKNGAIIDAFPQ
ncbi:hypothetical protein AB0M83_29290 [Amycolatopsis sp. NPDC051106]|uniref:CdiA C-terminal domain-containing protein n=1 Tax=unclassified Amycolatopsis TaxID=2618356 RepID=UPI0034378B67